jgi:hypothetical protein
VVIALTSAFALTQTPAFAGHFDCGTPTRARKAADRLVKEEDREPLWASVSYAFASDKASCVEAGGPGPALEAAVAHRLGELDERLLRASKRLAEVTADGEIYVMASHNGSLHELGQDYERQVDGVTVVVLNRSSNDNANVEIDLRAEGVGGSVRTIRMTQKAPRGRLIAENWDLYDWSPKDGTLTVGEVRFSDGDVAKPTPQRAHIAEPSSAYASGIAGLASQQRFLTRIAAELAAKRMKRTGRVAAAKMTGGSIHER